MKFSKLMTKASVLMVTVFIAVDVAHAEPCRSVCARLFPSASKASPQISVIAQRILAVRGAESAYALVDASEEILVLEYTKLYSKAPSNLSTIRMLLSRCADGPVFTANIYRIATGVYLNLLAPSDAFDQLRTCQK